MKEIIEEINLFSMGFLSYFLNSKLTKNCLFGWDFYFKQPVKLKQQ